MSRVAMHSNHLWFSPFALLILGPAARGCNSQVDIPPPHPSARGNRSCTFRSAYPGFLCSDGVQCIKAAWACDGGAADCEDGSDEIPEVCGHDYCVFESYYAGFTCSDGQQCIKAAWKCDGGTPDCDDGSDESPGWQFNGLFAGASQIWIPTFSSRKFGYEAQ